MRLNWVSTDEHWTEARSSQLYIQDEVYNYLGSGIGCVY